MIFNHARLATIIAFDLPINDIIQLNMARANFVLNRAADNNAADASVDDDDMDGGPGAARLQPDERRHA
ncbi:MAG: hypothetical protein ACR5LG_08865 [Sodalis sp. (in: enterobacteria)]|uniref:hypothetical protein n=1 Tax=Sodalis sp. (in: enterobacteria) TaxID=1898979 RepID=UPI003F4160A3